MPMVSAATSMPRIVIQARPTRAAHETFRGEQEEHDDGEDKEYCARG
jgi:hypothetical protein